MQKINFLFAVLFSLSTYHSFAQNGTTEKDSFTNQEFHNTHTPDFTIDGSQKPIKNIILMIGDGMGLAHLSAAMYANNNSLTITNLQSCGMVKTQSKSNFITDSAASGTAYATGTKTKNGTLGLDAEGNRLKNIPETIIDLGFKSGIVTTDNLDGATPSAFFAHQPDRGMSKEIWEDIIHSPLAFFAAGSIDIFKAQSKKVQEGIKERFKIIENIEHINLLDFDKVGYLPPKKETASVNENRGDFLPEATQKAIEFLSNKSPNGFFLMVEGAKIDKSSHSRDFEGVVKEVLDFDRAVEKVIRFAEKDQNTLVIITADHETGELSLRDGNIAEGMVKGHFSSNKHSSIMVPLFTYGPQSYLFTGTQENSDVGTKIIELFKNQFFISKLLKKEVYSVN